MRVFLKKVLVFLLVFMFLLPSVFAEDYLVSLSGDCLAGCSFLKKSILGLSNFRNIEYEFSESNLYVTNYKSNTYSNYSYTIAENFIYLTKISGEDYFPQSKIQYSLTSDHLLSKYQLKFFFDDGSSLVLVEEESLRKTAQDFAFTAGMASAVLGISVNAFNAALQHYLNKYGYPTTADYGKMNLNQDFSPYVGESNGAILSSNLQKAGISKPQNAAAHHIVPKKSSVGNANVAREILAEVGIDLDNPINGVYLPTDKDFAELSGMAYHSVEEYMHKSGFVSGLTERLTRARGDSSLIKEVLSDARNLLLTGETW